MAFFDTLKQNLMTASQVTMDKSKNTAEILKLKDQIRQDKREIRSATCDILPNLQRWGLPNLGKFGSRSITLLC